MPPPEHWRAVALREFPKHEEFVSSDDEEYGIYNLFFQLREAFARAVASGDASTASRIARFGGKCLAGELSSDGEDIALAAGVSLFEHVFEDTPEEQWLAIFAAMPHSVYLGCRPYVEQWSGATLFSRLERAAEKSYG